MRAPRFVAWVTGVHLLVLHGCSTPPPDVDAIVKPYIDSGQAPGMAIGLFGKNGEEYYCYGNIAGGVSARIDEKTLFEIGSISKVFTSLVLADMVERGELQLDDTLDKLLPKDAPAPARAAREITLEQLATHTSGLPRVPTNMVIEGTNNPYAAYDEAALYEYLGMAKLAADPGKQWAYSNLGVGLLGNLVAHRAGIPFEQLVIDRVCKPLDMQDTVATLTPEQENRLAHGYSGDQPVPNWDFNALVGCGGLRSTASDLLKFAAAQLGRRASNLDDAIKAALKVQKPTGEHPALTQALGWMVVSNREGETLMIYHSGATGGYRSFIGYRPSMGTACVVLCNSTFDVENIGVRILGGPAALPRVHDVVEVDPSIYADYVGRYQLVPGALFLVSQKDGKLVAQLTGQEEFKVYPESETRFFYKAVDAQITFLRDADGKVDRLILHQFGKDQTAPRLGPETESIEVKLDTALLDKYVGEYRTLLGMTFTVTKMDDHLEVQITGQPKLEVYPKSEKRFFYKVVVADIEFTADSVGKVIGLTLFQDGKKVIAVKSQ